ncbi:hypothetical protein PR003_g24749 [Phytophthora rubi]|uniref:Uncharacterized protein n=1 Tax=Phytophthora rubi TaxID=129364 RepID=A0A6A4CNJ6_9STRA|nr:hypothetical protein PR003_g24749 [Phytophthora rubi]
MQGGSRGSSESSERLDRLEGLLEGMAKQQAQFMANQVKLQEQLQRRSEPSHMPPYENQYGASSAFTDFIKARDRRMRVDSLNASMLSVGPTAPMLPAPTRPVEQATNVQQPQQAPPQQPYVPSPSPEQFVPPTNFGIKIPKPRDLDWPGFGKFSGKEVYPGLGADFKSCRLRFLQRLAAAQQMSGGDWPEEFRILALNGKLDGTALVYFEGMAPLWTAESPTLEHVLQSLCKSAPPYLQSAMLTRLNSQRVDYLQQAPELVAFAIEFEANIFKQEIEEEVGCAEEQTSSGLDVQDVHQTLLDDEQDGGLPDDMVSVIAGEEEPTAPVLGMPEDEVKILEDPARRLKDAEVEILPEGDTDPLDKASLVKAEKPLGPSKKTRNFQEPIRQFLFWRFPVIDRLRLLDETSE